MPNLYTLTPVSDQARAGIDLQLLIENAFAPVEDRCDGRKTILRQRQYVLVPRKWRKSELVLRSKFLGLVLSYKAREALKYKAPADDAPIEDWIIALLRTARSHWSRAVFLEGHRCQFDVYLQKYLQREVWFRQLPGRWLEAAAIVGAHLALSQ